MPIHSLLMLNLALYKKTYIFTLDFQILMLGWLQHFHWWNIFANCRGGIKKVKEIFTFWVWNCIFTHSLLRCFVLCSKNMNLLKKRVFMSSRIASQVKLNTIKSPKCNHISVRRDEIIKWIYLNYELATAKSRS